MVKNVLFFWVLLTLIFILDQYVKFLILEGLRFRTDFIDFTFVLNNGVAFSMFSFLGEYLKYIQSTIIILGISYVFVKGYLQQYLVPLAILFGAGISNVYDRFIHGGVVDYVYWHFGFDFAIFNLADVLIDLAVVMILWIHWRKK